VRHLRLGRHPLRGRAQHHPGPVRASYDGPLYQVRRASDNATTNIHPLSAGGVANAATQDSFCAGTTGVITEIYDQSGNGNNLTQAPGGGAAGGPDNLADATAAPVTVGGQKAYGVYVAAGTGYRDDSTRNIATGDQAEGEYAIFDDPVGFDQDLMSGRPGLQIQLQQAVTSAVPGTSTRSSGSRRSVPASRSQVAFIRGA
jgi:hypothetical protein